MQQASGSTAHVQEGLQCLQGVACALRSKAGAPSKEPRSGSKLGCSRGRSVQAASSITKTFARDDAEIRLPPHEYAELETSAQENVPQRSDACSARFPHQHCHR